MGDELVIENPYYLRFAYNEFLKTEGVPVIEGYIIDCLEAELQPWPRLGGKGAYVHLVGRSDYLSCYLAEIAPGGQLNPEQHLHDELIYVLKGRGATSIQAADGAKYTFEWGPGSLFGIPMNAGHQHFNGSGSEPARFAALTNLPIILNIFHNTDFVFNNSYVFRDRVAEERYFKGEGEFRAVRPGRHNWETSFVPDLVSFQLPEWKERGAGGRNIQFCLADSALHAHISEFPVGTYKKAHAHNAGAHIFCVSGHGYSLLWREGENPVGTKRVDWKPGMLYAPPDGPTYHQHFNTASQPSRYLALAFGGVRYPVLDSKISNYEGMDKSVEDGGFQVEYEDEDPRIHELFKSELAKLGIESRMGEFLGARAGR